MKILILNYEYPPLGGGAATATQNLLKELSKRKDLTATLVTSSVGEKREEKFSENIDIIYLNIKKKGNLHNQSKKDLLRYSFECWKWLRKNSKNYDLIHAFFGVPSGFLALLTGKPYIVSLRGSDVPFYSEKFKILDKFIFQHLDKLIWKKAEYIVANSEGLRDLAYDTYDKKEIGVIYNGVDTKNYYPSKTEREIFTIISTSRLISRKGLNYLIDAFKDFSIGKKEIELKFFGDGEQREELQELVKEYNLEKCVTFYGEAKREEIQKELRNASIFVLPSLNEGMSNSLLEAMASGLPVIATDVGGTKELVDSSNGIIVKKKSSKDILNALEILYKDKQKRVAMGRASRLKTEEMSWSRMAEEYINLYLLSV